MSVTTATYQQPVWFIPHGAGPCFFMDWQPADTWLQMADFLAGVIPSLPQRPRAIVVISAHWQSERFAVTGAAQPELIYDYYGFPESTYSLTYPAAGAPDLAAEIVALLQQQQLPTELEMKRGWDHGVFIPLKVMLPDASIPVVQVALRQDNDAAAHLALGRALAPLRAQGVMLVASGMSFHNMRGYGDARYTAPSVAFDEWLTETLVLPEAQRTQALVQWQQAPYAQDCHPPGKEEHFVPLLVAAGAAGTDPGAKVYSQQVLKTQLSGFRFGNL